MEEGAAVQWDTETSAWDGMWSSGRVGGGQWEAGSLFCKNG